MTELVVEKVNEVWIRVFSDQGTERELSDFFTYEYPGARFTPAYKQRLWDGKIRLFDVYRHTLYVGLLGYVEKFAKDRGYKVTYTSDDINSIERIEINEIEEYAKWLDPHGRGKPIQIRDYQLEAVHTALERKRVLLLSPTASGKSFIIYTTMRWHLDEGRKCIIIVPTTSLVEQLYADFADYSSANGWRVEKHCQKLYSGFSKDFSSDVLITTWQSIYKQPPRWFSQFDVLFGDEAHQFKAKSLTQTMEKMHNIEYRIGTTGTIDNKKVHKLVLEGIFGPLHRVTTTKKLMENSSLTNLNITCLMLKYDDVTKQGRKNNQYQDEIDFLISHERRNNFITNLVTDRKGTSLILFQYVKKHGKVLYEMVKERVGKDRPVFFVHGGTDTATREAIRHAAENGDDAIIVASFGTFSTGINIPSIETIVFASPSKSKIRNLQSIGRGLRLKEGKSSCELFDIADDLSWKSWKNHTLNHFGERIKTYSEEKFDFKIIEVSI